MATGDFLDPILEGVLRVLLPRHGGAAALDWVRVVPLTLGLIVVGSLKRYLKKLEALENPQFEDTRSALRGSMICCWLLVVFSALMLRFGGAG